MNTGTSFTVKDDIRRMKDEVFLLRLQHVVLVEGRDDVHFWGHILEPFAPQQFKIFPYVNFPTENTAGSGSLKTHYLPYADRDLILCLDSDYNYLLGDQTLARPFVFQTYTHSPENFLCYAPSLSNILALGTRTEQAAFDFESFLSRYSEAVYRWLIGQLYLKQTTQTEPEHPPSFAFITDSEADLLALARQTETRSAPLFAAFENTPEFQTFVTQLTDLGLTPQNAYLFVRGHDLLERVVLKLLIFIHQPIVNQEFARLDNPAKADYQAYRKQHTFERLLAQNTDFADCPFYLKITESVQRAFA